MIVDKLKNEMADKARQQNEAQIRTGMNIIVSVFSLVTAVVVGCVAGWKAVLLWFSIVTLLTFLLLITTSIVNATVGRREDGPGGVFWRFLFALVSSAGFAIYFSM